MSALGLVLGVQLLVAPSASAVTIGICADSGQYHQFGHVYNAGNFYGEYGRFTIYNNTVPSPSTNFSLTHIYMFAGGAAPEDAPGWVEVGYYKGAKFNGGYVTTPHYYYAYKDDGAYHEVNSASAPTVGTTDVFEVLFTGHNYTTGKDDWAVYWHSLSAPKATLHLTNRPSQHALGGGEVSSDSSNYVQMHAHGVAAQQIQKSPSGGWTNWTLANFGATKACRPASGGLTVTTTFTDYTATGQI